jgi:hypothetical protein
MTSYILAVPLQNEAHLASKPQARIRLELDSTGCLIFASGNQSSASRSKAMCWGRSG